MGVLEGGQSGRFGGAALVTVVSFEARKGLGPGVKGCGWANGIVLKGGGGALVTVASAGVLCVGLCAAVCAPREGPGGGRGAKEGASWRWEVRWFLWQRGRVGSCGIGWWLGRLRESWRSGGRCGGFNTDSLLLLFQSEPMKRGQLQDLFVSELRLTTLLLWFIW